MPDNDPGNSGGSIVIPNSPVPPPKVWFRCDGCSANFETLAQLYEHHRSHVQPQPRLSIDGADLPTTIDLYDTKALSRLQCLNATAVQIDGRSYLPIDLIGTLQQRNGDPSFELVLLGNSPSVRHAYLVRVLMFRQKVLDKIDRAFLRDLNVPDISAETIMGFGKTWSGSAEKVYADALAGFRLAVMMRERLDESTRGVVDYRPHLADCQSVLSGISRSMAAAVVGACRFIGNVFTVRTTAYSDYRIENGLRTFNRIATGLPQQWCEEGLAAIHLILDSRTDRLLEVIDGYRLGQIQFADQLLTQLESEPGIDADPNLSMKIAALQWSRGGRPDLAHRLGGDPIFKFAVSGGSK